MQASSIQGSFGWKLRLCFPAVSDGHHRSVIVESLSKTGDSAQNPVPVILSLTEILQQLAE